jgi:phosphohistidine phosphatase
LRTLVLMRHATAGMGPAGAADLDRVISERGQREAASAGAWLDTHELGPGAGRSLLVSTAVRARQTADHLGGPRQLDGALYNAAEETLIAAIQGVEGDPNTIVMVAHNPGIHRLAWRLAETAPDETVARDGIVRPEPPSSFAPATMAIFTVTVSWPELEPGRAGLIHVVPPVG